MRPEIVVLDGHTLNPGDNPWDDLAELGALTVYERTPAELIAERGRGADILLTNKTPLRAASLAELPRLRFVAVLATGYDVVDVDTLRARAVPVSNVPEYGTESVAQFVFALLLELCHHVGTHDAAVHAGEWQRCPDFSFSVTPLVELAGKTMGVIGYGRIGRRVAALARVLGMNVLAHSRTRRDGEPVTWCGSEELFAAADVVSLHCPLTAQNRRFVDAALLARMRPGSFLINTARGALIDEHALAAALRAGAPAGAALDVVSVEPIAADNPLLGAPHCLLTPHIAWATLAARRRLMATTVENVRGFLAGKPVNVVNGKAGPDP